MKTFISLLLALIFAIPVLAQDHTSIPPGIPLEKDPPPNCAGAALYLAVGVTLGCLVLYLYRVNADPWDAHIFVLMRDHYDGNWEAIATRTLALSPTKAKAVFWDAIKKDGGYDSGNRYRVIDLGPANPIPIDNWLTP